MGMQMNPQRRANSSFQSLAYQAVEEEQCASIEYDGVFGMDFLRRGREVRMSSVASEVAGMETGTCFGTTPFLQ